MDEYILRTVYLKKIVNGRTIVNNINLDIKKGEIFGFLGPDGSGKTTTIKMIVGLTSITSGEIYIGDQSLKKEFKKAMMDVGYIVNPPELYDFITGFENLKLISKLYKGINKGRIEYVAKLCGVDETINKKISEYTAEMKMRLSLALAILAKPKLLILDEPTVGLNEESSKKIYGILKTLVKEEKVSIFISSNNLCEMKDLCDRVAIINDGEIIDIKSSEDLSEIEEPKETDFVTINTDSNTEALNLLLGLGYKATETDFGIEIEIDHDNISELILVIINSKINVVQVTSNKSSQADNSYIKLIGGEAV